MSLSIDNEKCEGCGICVAICPVRAISIIDDKAIIDRNICTECLLCINECPNSAIRQVSDRELSLKTRENPIPALENRSSPHQKQIISGSKRNSQISEKSGFLDELKKAVHYFFQSDSSFSMSRRSGGRKYGRHRRSRRGGRF
jgi:MinD superfamily P-loop ATPase